MAQTVNARVQFSTASVENWEKVNPGLKQGELVMASKPSGKVLLKLGALGGSKYKDSLLVWDEENAEELTKEAKNANNSAIQAFNNTRTFAQKAQGSAVSAKQSEDNAKESETASKTSEVNAKASETNANQYATSAKQSADNSKTYDSDAQAQAKQAKDSAKSAQDNANAAITQANNSAKSANSANAKAQEATESATKAKASEDNAKTSEESAKMHEENAKKYADSINPETLATKEEAGVKYQIKRGAEYKEGEILTTPNLPPFYAIVVTKAGTTGDEEPDWDTIRTNVEGG